MGDKETATFYGIWLVLFTFFVITVIVAFTR